MNNAYREKFNELDLRHDQSQAPKPREDYAPRVQRARQPYAGRRRARLDERAVALYRKRRLVPCEYTISECVVAILVEVDRLRKQVSGLNAHDALDRIEAKLAESTNISRGALFDVRNMWENVALVGGTVVTLEDEYDASAPLTFDETEENQE